MDTVTEIKNRADIAEFIGQYTSLVRSGKNLKGLCPFHSEKHGSFFVYPDNQTWHCFGACGTGGDIFSFIMKKEGLTFGEALERLAEKYGVSLPSFKPPSGERDHLAELYRINAAAARYYHDLLLTSPEAEIARFYLQKRGIDQSSVDDFQIGFAKEEWQALKSHLNSAGWDDDALIEAGLLGRSDSGRTYDRFRNQIIIPIADIRGRITGFGARVLDDSQPKYLNSPETPVFSKSSVIFGINLAAAAIRSTDSTTVVEGYFDAIVSRQHGFKNTVASMGTAVTEKQIAILKKLSSNVILALDADEAGEEAMIRCVPLENLLDTEIKVATAPPGQDPDDVIRTDAQKWQSILAEAIPLIDFVFDKASFGADLHTAHGKSNLAKKLLPVVSGIKDPVRRGHYLAELASRVGTSSAELRLSMVEEKKRQISPKYDAGSQTLVQTVTQIEDYLLALLIKHPEMKQKCQSIRPEYFQTIENREIFHSCLKSIDSSAARENLDEAVRQRFDALMSMSVVETRMEDRFVECSLRLEEKYLKTTAVRIQEILNSENDKGSVAELLKYREQGLSLDSRLAELFKRKQERRTQPGR